MTRVDFYKGGGDSRQKLSSYGPWRVWLGSAAKPPYRATWRWNPVLEYHPTGGKFTLTARAVDNCGAAAEASVSITISRKAPGSPPRRRP